MTKIFSNVVKSYDPRVALQEQNSKLVAYNKLRKNDELPLIVDAYFMENFTVLKAEETEANKESQEAGVKKAKQAYAHKQHEERSRTSRLKKSTIRKQRRAKTRRNMFNDEDDSFGGDKISDYKLDLLRKEVENKKKEEVIVAKKEKSGKGKKKKHYVASNHKAQQPGKKVPGPNPHVARETPRAFPSIGSSRPHPLTIKKELENKDKKFTKAEKSEHAERMRAKKALKVAKRKLRKQKERGVVNTESGEYFDSGWDFLVDSSEDELYTESGDLPQTGTATNTFFEFEFEESKGYSDEEIIVTPEIEQYTTRHTSYSDDEMEDDIFFSDFFTNLDLFGDVVEKVKSLLTAGKFGFDIKMPGRTGEMIFYGATFVSVVIGLCFCKDVKSMIALLSACAFTYGLFNYASYIKEFADKFIKKNFNYITTYLRAIRKNAMDSGRMSFKDRVMNFIGSVVNSAFISSIQEFFLSLVSLRLFEKPVAHKFISFLGKPEKMNILSASLTLIQSVLSLIEMGSLALISGNADYLIGEKNMITAFLNKSEILLGYDEFLYSGLPVPGYKCEREHYGDLNCMIDTGKKLLSELVTSDIRHELMTAAIARLERSSSHIYNSLKARNRLSPFGVVLFGDPGIGKSKLVINEVVRYSKIKNRTYKSEMIFQKSRTTQYWDGYNPIEHPYIHIPEVGNVHKDMLGKIPDNTLIEINALSDSLTCRLDTAFKDKGKVFAYPELLVIDTNNLGLHANKVLNCPGALRRRFVYVQISVLDEFCISHSDRRISVTKSLRSDRSYLDKYKFEIIEWSDKDVPLVVETFTNLHDYDTYMENRMRVHIDNEEKSRAKLESTFNLQPSFNNEVKTESGKLPSYSQNFWTYIKPMFILYWYVIKFLGCDIFMQFLSTTGLYGNFSDNAYKELGFRCGLCLLFLMNPLLFMLLFGIILFFKYFVMEFLKNLPFFGKISKFCTNVAVTHVKSYKRIKYLVGLGEYVDPFTSNEWLLMGTYAASASISIAFLISMARYLRKPLIQSESSEFVKDRESEVNKKLETIEEKICAGRSITRIPSKIHSAWDNVKFNYTLLAHTGDIAALERSFCNNTRIAVFYIDGKKLYTRLLGICGDVFLVNKHAFQDKDTLDITVLNGSDIDNLEHQRRFIYEKRQSVQFQDDFILFRTPGLRVKDLSKHLNSRESKPLETAMARILNKEVRVYRLPHALVAKNVGEREDTVISDGFTYEFSGHFAGMCGTPLYAKIGNGAALIGIHTAGAENSKDSYAAAIYREDVKEALVRLNGISVYTEVCSLEPPVDLFMPPAKSFINYEEMPGVEYYGHDGKHVMLNNKSRLKNTKFSKELPMFFHKHFDYVPEEIFDRPIMKPRMIDGEFISPYNVAVRKIGISSKPLKTAVSAKVISILFKHIHSGLISRGLKELKPLDITTAINGAIEDGYLRRINCSTSPGHGFTGLKGDHIPIVGEEDNFVVREPTLDLKLKILNSLEQYFEGGTSGFVYRTQLKDEPRSTVKVRAGKTRVFYMMNLTDLILSRMFLAPFYTLMVQYADLFFTTVGINMHKDADALIRAFIKWQGEMMEGDYKNYDQTMPPEIAYIVGTIIYMVLEAFGYSGEALICVKAILSDNITPILIMLGEMFSKGGHQPSGRYATAEDNSLRGLVMLVYVFVELCPDLDFFEVVIARTYGDDVIASVKEVAQDRFNNHTYRDYIVEHFGMDFTAAKKDAELQKFVPIEDISFLKRKFVLNEELDVYEAPIHLDSVYKSLEWVNPSKVITEDLQVLSTCGSFLWEIYFHEKNIEKFHIIRDELIMMLHEHYKFDVAYCQKTLPVWSYINEAIYPSLVTESGILHESNVSLGSLGALRGGLFSPVVDTSASLNIENVSIRELSMPALSVETVLRRASNIFNYLEEVKGYPEMDLGDAAVDARIALLKRQATAIEEHLLMNPSRMDSFKLTSLKRRPFLKNHLGGDWDKNRLLIMEKLNDIQSTVKFYESISEKKTLRKLIFESGVLDGEMHDGKIRPDHVDTIETFTEVVGEDTSVHYAGTDEKTYIDSGQYTVHDLDDFFGRAVELTTFTMAPSTQTSLILDVWDLWSLIPNIRAKLKNFGFFKGNLHLRMSISGTPFHYGRVVAAYIPYPERQSTILEHEDALALQPLWRPMMLNYLSQQLGAKTININENKPLEIVCPFLSHKQTHRLFNSDTTAIGDTTSLVDLQQAGSLYFYTINETKSVSATPSNVSVQIYAYMTDVELGCPTGTVLAITTESGSLDERKVGPIENAAGKLADVSKALTTVPHIAPFAKASSLIFSGIKGFSAMMGWSYPINTNYGKRVHNEPLSNGANVIGMSTGKRLTLTPDQELTVDPSVVGVQTDELGFQTLAAIETYFDTFSWNDNSSPLVDVLYKCRVSPQLGTHYVGTGSNPDCFQPTPMAFCASFFNYWRGTIEFRFEIVCSAYHRGKLAIIYEPNTYQGALITTDIDMNKQYVKVIDIQETQSFSMCVEWAMPRPWCSVIAATDVIANLNDTFSYTQNAQLHINGFLYITPFTALQSPDNSDIEINVYACCKDLRLNSPTDRKLPGTRAILTESGDIDAPTIDQEVSCMVLNPTGADTVGISEYYFGEEVQSFRTLAKRFNTTNNLTVAASVAISKTVNGVLKILPSISPAYGGASVTFHNYIGHLRYCFLGCKGSVRKRLHLYVNNVSTTPTQQVKITLSDPSTTMPVEGTSFTLVPPVASMSGSLSFATHTNAGIEVEIPFYSANLYCYSAAQDLTGITNLADYHPEFTKGYQANFETHNEVDGGYIVEETATGEDFMLMRFIGVPFYSL